MKKRVVTMMLCGAMAAGLLAGCSGGSSETTSGNASGGQTQAAGGDGAAAGDSSQAGGEVTWWTWSTEATDAFAQQIEYAETNNPNLKVNIQYTANNDYWTKLPVAIAGGTGPDIYQMTRPSFEMYAASNQAMDLTDIIAGSEVVTSVSGDDMFISGKIAMIAAGIWKVPSYNNITTFNWDVVELPFDSATGGRKSSSNVLGLVINPNTKNLDGAVALLEQLVQPDCQKILADSHVYIPALESVRSGYFEGDVPDNIVAFENALSYLHPNTLTQYIPYAQFTTEYTNALGKAYRGEMTMQDALTEACGIINGVMEENKAQFAQ